LSEGQRQKDDHIRLWLEVAESDSSENFISFVRIQIWFDLIFLKSQTNSIWSYPIWNQMIYNPIEINQKSEKK
jgi:hypothetical protein